MGGGRWQVDARRRMLTLAGISYSSCKSVRSSMQQISAPEHTKARSGMKRSPKTRTSRDAIAGRRGAAEAYESRICCRLFLSQYLRHVGVRWDVYCAI